MTNLRKSCPLYKKAIIQGHTANGCGPDSILNWLGNSEEVRSLIACDGPACGMYPRCNPSGEVRIAEVVPGL